jgi:hypothetical protein
MYTAYALALIEILAKIAAGVGVLMAALTYYNQVRIKRAEWLKSLFEKFFENPTYKDVRGWLDYNELAEKLAVSDEREKRINEEKFTDFLNFFEFIGVLYSRNQLTYTQVCDVFEYYLKKIALDADCRRWIDQYGFEKLKALLARLRV